MSRAVPTPGEGRVGLSLCTQISGTQEGGRWWLLSDWGSATTQVPPQLCCSPRWLLAERGDHKSLFLNMCPTSSCLHTRAASSATAAASPLVSPRPPSSPAQRPRAFPSPAVTNLPFSAQKPKAVMGLGRVPRWHPGRKTCSEPPEGCRGWILLRRIPRRDRSITTLPALCRLPWHVLAGGTLAGAHSLNLEQPQHCTVAYSIVSPRLHARLPTEPRTLLSL